MNGPRQVALVIEDDEDLALLISSHLQREGFEVLVEQDAREGLRAARKSNPDIVILDLRLRRSDGFEVLTG